MLDGLTKTFSDKPVVNNLTYTLETGVYGLLGINGSGKTTLMRMLCTLLTPTAGSITWQGKDIFAMGRAYRTMLGYLPQEFGFYPDFSVEDYLYYIASLKGLRPATAKERVNYLLGQVGLEKVRRQKMKKRPCRKLLHPSGPNNFSSPVRAAKNAPAPKASQRNILKVFHRSSQYSPFSALKMSGVNTCPTASPKSPSSRKNMRNVSASTETPAMPEIIQMTVFISFHVLCSAWPAPADRGWSAR